MSQKQRILDYLKTGKELTRLNAWHEVGVIECPARICELRKEGYHIKTEMFEVTNRWGEKARVAKWSMAS